MNTLAVKFDDHAIEIDFTQSALHVVLADGREVFAPLEWFPRLRDANMAQRKNWRFIGNGIGVHWPDVDEDIAISTLLSKAD